MMCLDVEAEAGEQALVVVEEDRLNWTIATMHSSIILVANME